MAEKDNEVPPPVEVVEHPPIIMRRPSDKEAWDAGVVFPDGFVLLINREPRAPVNVTRFVAPQKIHLEGRAHVTPGAPAELMFRATVNLVGGSKVIPT